MPRRKAEKPSRSRRGDGSVYQRKDGKWVGEATVGRRADGARDRRFVYADTCEEAQEKLRKLLHERDRGLLADPAKQTVGEFLASWLQDVAKPTVRPRTYDCYSDIVERHIKPALGGVRLSKLSPQHLQRFYREKQEQGLTRTVRLCHAVLHRALGQAAKWGLIPRNADLVDPPKVPKKEFSRSLLRRLRDSSPPPRGTGSMPCMFFAVTCGLRQGELLGLKWEDLDLERGTLQVRRQLQWVRAEGEERKGKKRAEPKWVLTEPKSAKSRRVVSLPAVAVAVLKKHKAAQAEERLRMGEVWQDLGFVFCTSIGTPKARRTSARGPSRLSWKRRACRRCAFTTCATPARRCSSRKGYTRSSCRSSWGTLR
jgi:Phage integrase family.